MHSTKPQKWQTYAEVITCERRCVTHDTSITQSVVGAPTEGLFGDSLSHMKRQTECLTVRSLDACEAVPSLFTCPLHFHRPGLTTIPRTHSLANLHTESCGAMRDLSVADIRKSAGKPERFVIFDFANFYSKNAWKTFIVNCCFESEKKKTGSENLRGRPDTARHDKSSASKWYARRPGDADGGVAFVCHEFEPIHLRIATTLRLSITRRREAAACVALVRSWLGGGTRTTRPDAIRRVRLDGGVARCLARCRQGRLPNNKQTGVFSKRPPMHSAAGVSSPSIAE